MKFTIFSTLASILAVSSVASAAGPYPKAPGLQYLYTVNITGGEPALVGPGPRGFRISVPIVKGAFSGPKLKGTVLPIGGDWALIDNNGTVVQDVRQTFKTDDGAIIQVFETGSTQPGRDGSEAWVRLTYETGSEKYYWLNSVVAIGILRLVSNSDLTIDTWMMTAP
ncbi:hypothetical protein B0T16DRAFT_440186 [Cercophora newfieldiana]|uniref:Uncharacterized protein n=1 Tax=Cercophora newfieldiana TaxID=92897 RepID=A0AA40CIP8_9PEZI|nr:hypothetical protein B0T16DRAFT_440186 [Cercophora newfieldiana]